MVSSMDDTRIAFFLPMVVPRETAQEKKTTKRNGRTVVYEPNGLRDARAKFMAYLPEYAPDAPWTGAIRLYVRFYFTGRNRKGWKTTRPDTDNMIKLFKDCMTKCGYWKDDAQVASETVEKCWGTVPGIAVEVVKL